MCTIDSVLEYACIVYVIIIVKKISSLQQNKIYSEDDILQTFQIIIFYLLMLYVILQHVSDYRMHRMSLAMILVIYYI